MPTADCQYTVGPQEKLPALIRHSLGTTAHSFKPSTAMAKLAVRKFQASQSYTPSEAVSKTGTHTTKHEERLKGEGTTAGGKEEGRQLSQKPTVVKTAPENLVEELPAFPFESAKENLKGKF